MLRIVTGRFRGRRLYTVQDPSVRPTADRVKQSLYNVLQGLMPGSNVLDLYAGSGNLGLEALSRGAHHVVFVEKQRVALDCLRRNLETLGVQDEVQVVRGDVLHYLARNVTEPFDLVLADPPYKAGVEDALLVAVDGPGLRTGGWFVLRHGREWSAPAEHGGLRLRSSKRFGNTIVDFFVREGEEADTT